MGKNIVKKVVQKAAQTGRKKKKKKTTSGRKKRAGAKAKSSIGSVKNAKRQIRAKSAAKRNRIKTSGLTTRTRGHVSARGKRAQARRDSR